MAQPRGSVSSVSASQIALDVWVGHSIFGIHSLELDGQGSRCRIEGSRVGVQALGFGDQGLGFGV